MRSHERFFVFLPILCSPVTSRRAESTTRHDQASSIVTTQTLIKVLRDCVSVVVVWVLLNVSNHKAFFQVAPVAKASLAIYGILTDTEAGRTDFENFRD